MGSLFTNFHAGCNGPVPLRRLFRGATSTSAVRRSTEPGTREHRIFSTRPRKGPEQQDRRGIEGSSTVPRLQDRIPKLDFIGLCGAGLHLGGQSQDGYTRGSAILHPSTMRREQREQIWCLQNRGKIPE